LIFASFIEHRLAVGYPLNDGPPGGQRPQGALGEQAQGFGLVRGAGILLNPFPVLVGKYQPPRAKSLLHASHAVRQLRRYGHERSLTHNV
jgi:hypothetical protein